MSRRDRAPTRRSYPWSDMDPDRRNAVILVGGIGVVIVFALALIAYGYYNDRIAPNHETVLRLGDDTYDFNDLKRRVRAGVLEGSVNLSEETAIPGVLADMEREAVTREAAKREGLTISEPELLAKIAEKVQLAADSSRNQVAPALRARLLKNGLSLGEFEDIAKAEIAETRIKESIEKGIPVEAEQVAVRIIVTSGQSSALQAKQRIDEGESWAQVTASFSEDETSKAKGGDVGFVPRGALPPDVDKVAFSITGVSDVIETKDAFYLIQVLGKEIQPVENEARQLVITTTFAVKLGETREALGSKPALNQGQVQRILRDMPASGV